jgi:hypothetical protein
MNSGNVVSLHTENAHKRYHSSGKSTPAVRFYRSLHTLTNDSTGPEVGTPIIERGT